MFSSNTLQTVTHFLLEFSIDENCATNKFIASLLSPWMQNLFLIALNHNRRWEDRLGLNVSRFLLVCFLRGEI